MAEYELGRQPVAVELYSDEHMIDDDGNRFFAGARIDDDVDHELPMNSVATIDGDHIVFDGDSEDTVRIHRNNVDLSCPGVSDDTDELWSMIGTYSPGVKLVTYEIDDDGMEVLERGSLDLTEDSYTEPRDDTVRIVIDVANSERWNDDSRHDWVSVWRIHGIGLCDTDLHSVFADEGDWYHTAGIGISVEGDDVVFRETISQSPPHGTITYRVPVDDVEVTGWDNYSDESDIPDAELGLHLLE